MRVHADARRRFVGDIFNMAQGDFNAVTLHPGVVIAWHRHDHQDDRIYVLYGSATIQAIDPDGERHVWNHTSDDLPLFIARGWWHGYSSANGATLLSFNGPKKYDGTDEARLSLTEMPWIPTS